MIYLIWGSPRSWKTTLSKKLSQDLDIPYISTDYLRLVIMPYFKWVDKDINFPFESMFDKYWDIEEFFKNSKWNDLLNADVKEAETLWEGIMWFIEYLLLSNTDYIVEWVHFLPKLVNKLQDKKNIKIVTLTKVDQQKIFEWLIKNRGNGDWIADNINDNKVLEKVAESLSGYGKYFTEESGKYWLKVINTEQNFDDKIKAGLNYLEN